MNTSAELRTFYFTGANRYSLSASTYYVFVINYEGGDASNSVKVQYDNSSPTHSGNRCVYVSSWAAASARDACFYIYSTAIKKIGGVLNSNTKKISGVAEANINKIANKIK